MTAPATQVSPCSDCPWRRTSTRGWLGPLTADEWIQLAQSDELIACHQTIEVEGEWTPDTYQCRGAAMFRSNVMKSPRNPDAALWTPDRTRVFATPAEFLAHHDSPLATWLADQRAAQR